MSEKRKYPGILMLTLISFSRKCFQTVKDVEGMVVWSRENCPQSAMGIIFQEVLNPERSTGLFEFIDKASSSLREQIELGVAEMEYHA